MTKQSVEEIVNDIIEATEDITDLLLKATMTFENATLVDTALKGIDADALRVFAEHQSVVDKVADRLRAEHEQALQELQESKMTNEASLMDFSRALEHLKLGKKVARNGWNGKGMWIAVRSPMADSDMHRPYIFMCPIGGHYVPWVASQTDLLADDWVLVH